MNKVSPTKNRVGVFCEKLEEWTIRHWCRAEGPRLQMDGGSTEAPRRKRKKAPTTSQGSDDRLGKSCRMDPSAGWKGAQNSAETFHKYFPSTQFHYKPVSKLENLKKDQHKKRVWTNVSTYINVWQFEESTVHHMTKRWQQTTALKKAFMQHAGYVIGSEHKTASVHNDWR